MTGTREPHRVSIRWLRPSDVQDYRSIRLSALRTDAGSFGATHAAEAAMPVEGHALRLAGSQVFGAYDAGRIVGMIALRREEGARNAHKGLLWGFFVEPGYRRVGVGAALMSALIEAAGALVEQILLSAVAGNDAAIAFYEGFGFERYGLEPRALKSAGGYADEILMVLFLSEAGNPSSIRINN